MWRKGSLGDRWDLEHRDFNYVKQPHTPEEDKMWKEAGYEGQSYTGKMYAYPNEMPNYVYYIAAQLGLTMCGYNFYRMDGGDLMPPHKDHFESYMKFSGEKKEDILRYVLFLEDSKHGHYFKVGDQLIGHWEKGDWVAFDAEEWHEAGNLGDEPRYTLQITGVDRNKKYKTKGEYRQGLFWRNFESVDDNYGFIGYYLEESYRFLKDVRDPHFVFTGVGDIQFPFQPDTDFTIYLYEPLTFYIPGKEKNMGFYHEPCPEEYDSLMAIELDSILDVQDNNKITVKCCDYDVAKYFGKKYPTLNLECDDIFIKSLTGPGHVAKQDNGDPIRRYKKFICPNWRYTKHRHMIMSYLADKVGNFSWYFNVDSELKDSGGWVDYSKLDSQLKEQVLSGEKKLRKVQFSLDKEDSVVNCSYDENTYWPNGHYGITKKYIQKYRECFIAVVNETRFSQETANISEKVIDAIHCETPFILVAPPKSLQYMRELGFKTFEDFWDESYDLEEDPMKRMNKILQLLDYLNEHDDLEGLYNSMIPVLNYNKKFMINFKPI